MKELHKIFSGKDILKIIVVSYDYIIRKKIVTYVPLSHTDKLTFDMASAGAGIIGNYTLCSFRMKGVGTFLPGSGTTPFSGKKKKLSFEEEIRLEMECSPENLDDAVDMLLESHPYDEPAYEIYDFEKRSSEPYEFAVFFKRAQKISSVLKKLNRRINIDAEDRSSAVRTLYITRGGINSLTRKRAVKYGADAVFSIK